MADAQADATSSVTYIKMVEVADAGAVPTSVGHHDSSRSPVSSTALFTAALRAIESEKEVPLVRDPWAKILAGEYMAALKAQMAPEELAGWVEFLAVRSRSIDDWLTSRPLAQLVIVGSGLDTRALRLEALRSTQVFELEFAQVLEAKREQLKEAPVLAAKLVDVGANLATDPWESLLQEAGFDKTVPSCWLMEGLTGYLEEQELRGLLKAVTGLTAPGSRLFASFLSEEMRSDGKTLAMHRYFVKNAQQAADLLREFGWVDVEPEDINDASARYGLALRRPPHYLVQATRGSSMV